MNTLWATKVKFDGKSGLLSVDHKKLKGKHRTKPGDDEITFEQYAELMASIIGVLATPGIQIHVLSLEQRFEEKKETEESVANKKSKRDKDMAATAPKIKQDKRPPPPALTLRVPGYQNAKDTIKSRKSGKEDAVGSRQATKTNTVFHSEIFLEAPTELESPLIIEATRPKKIIGGGEARIVNEVVACALIDISKLSDKEETMTVSLLKPKAFIESEKKRSSVYGGRGGLVSASISDSGVDDEEAPDSAPKSGPGSRKVGGKKPERLGSKAAAKSGPPLKKAGTLEKGGSITQLF
jgi:hypothetical protein